MFPGEGRYPTMPFPLSLCLSCQSASYPCNIMPEINNLERGMQGQPMVAGHHHSGPVVRKNAEFKAEWRGLEAKKTKGTIRTHSLRRDPSSSSPPLPLGLHTLSTPSHPLKRWVLLPQSFSLSTVAAGTKPSTHELLGGHSKSKRQDSSCS